MKHFTHSQYNKAVLTRIELPRSLVTLYRYVENHLGEVFDIVKVQPCFTRGSGGVCRSNPNCPGLVLLDHHPFNRLPACYCWGERSIFNFEGDI